MNKSLLALSLLFLMATVVFGQLTAGLTGVPDTSYTTYSAYKSTKTKYPNISVVKEFTFSRLAAKKSIVYCKLGKRNLVIDAFYKKGNTSGKTAIVMIHGGGWRSGSRTQHYAMAQALANKGYVCFTPEYRLSTEALFPAAIYDVKAAIRWVRANAGHYGIDTSRIVIAGFSAGGEMAALIATTANMPLFEGTNCNTNFSSRVNALIDLDGTLSFVHPESGEGNDNIKTSAGTYWFGYSKKQNPKLWETASPISYVGASTPATLFINSSIARMHAGRDDFRKVLTDNGIYCEVKTYENSPHSFPLFHPWFNIMIDDMDAFLKKIFPAKL